MNIRITLVNDALSQNQDPQVGTFFSQRFVAPDANLLGDEINLFRAI